MASAHTPPTFDASGFNATRSQRTTLSIVARLEKKRVAHNAPDNAKTVGVARDGADYTGGLHLTYRRISSSSRARAQRRSRYPHRPSLSRTRRQIWR